MTEPTEPTEPTDVDTDVDTGEAAQETAPTAAAADYEGPRRRARREREERRAAQARATEIENARREAKRRVMGAPPDEAKRLGRRTIRGLKVLMWSAVSRNFWVVMAAWRQESGALEMTRHHPDAGWCPAKQAPNQAFFPAAGAAALPK